MIDALVAEYAVKRRLMLSVLPRASLSPFNAEYDHLVHRGFSRGSELGYPNRYIVNLRLSDAEQKKSFLQKWRYHLNKSEKAGLSFEYADASRLPEFSALYEKMLDRKKFADHSAYETVPALMAMSNDRLRPELFFVRHLGEVIAGAIIFKAGDRAVYLYGATNDRALPLRAGYFMHWNIIRWLRDNTPAKWYDLGGTDGFQGLHQFKKGMVGEAGVIQPVPPVANYAAHWWPRFAGTSAFVGRDFAQRALQRIDWLRAATRQARPEARRRRRRMNLLHRLLSQSTVIFGARLFGAGLTFLVQVAIARVHRRAGAGRLHPRHGGGEHHRRGDAARVRNHRHLFCGRVSGAGRGPAAARLHAARLRAHRDHRHPADGGRLSAGRVVR